MGDTSKVSRGSAVNFAFAFDDSDFSDRILRLEIAPDDEDDEYSNEDPTAPRKRPKRKRSNRKDSKSSHGSKVTSLHICSLVLAEKSPFFFKMFKNGMRESQQKNEVCLKINASEEATFMGLLRFMYGEVPLDSTSSADLVGLLVAADKFEVTSCMVYCVEMLLKFPMTLKHALFCLELPSSVLVSEIVKPLTDAAKKHIFELYKDFNKTHKEVLQLPVSAIEVVLGSKGLKVASEDQVFDFVLEWGRASYPELEKRREILTNRLAPLICFPNMSVSKLKEVIACTDFDQEVSNLVMKALFSKVELSCGHLTRDSVDFSNKCSSAGRVYCPHSVVFFDLKKSECLGLPFKRIDSPRFCLGGKLMFLRAQCGEENEFGLFVMRTKGSETFILDFELAVMKKSLMEFESKYKTSNHYLEEDGWGLPDLLSITWTEFMSKDSDYFIDDVIRLRAELSLRA